MKKAQCWKQCAFLSRTAGTPSCSGELRGPIAIAIRDQQLPVAMATSIHIGMQANADANA
jgi:hypothetical protein